MKEELAAYVYSSLDLPGKTKCFLSFPTYYYQQNNIIYRIIRSQYHQWGRKWGSGGVLCIVSFSYFENYCNVLTLFSVSYYFLSDAYLGQLE